MRIEEMRSGLAYLHKRTPGSGVADVETPEVRHADSPTPAREVRQTPSRVIPQSELEKNQWSVVSFDGVEAGGLTYSQATRLMTVLGENGINGLCIVTDAAALNVPDRPC